MSIEESDDDDMEEVPVPFTPHNIMHDSPPPVASPLHDGPPSPSLPLVPPIEEVQDILPFQGPVTVPLDADLNNDPLFIISRTPSPSHEAQDLRPPSPPIAEDWDAAEEMDVQAEEGEFARFISQVKGKDLSSVRKEIDDEIKALNEQKKAAMRDSEDITQQMVSQIMVREYGLDFTSDSMQTHLYYIILFLRRCYVFSVYHT
jgi:DNA excision repair protein ERCC-5